MKNLFPKKVISLKTFLFLSIFQLFFVVMNSQSLAINTTGATAHPSSILDVSSINKGMLIPSINLTNVTDVTTIASPAVSLIVYNINASIVGGSGKGFYYFNGSNWIKMIDGTTPLTGWSVSGNGSTIAGTNFVGTTDPVDLVFKTNGAENMRILNASGNIGINQPVPLEKLHINGNTRFQGNTYLTNNNTHYALPTIGLPLRLAGINSSDQLEFGDYSSVATIFRISPIGGISFQTPMPRLCIIGNGNVGINQAAPLEKLHINGNTLFQGNTYIINNNSHFAYNTVGAPFKLDGMNSSNQLDYGDYTAPGTTIFRLPTGLGMNFQNSMLISGLYIQSTTGNVGINQTAPLEKLHVNGNTRFQGNTYITNNNSHFAYNTSGTPFRLGGMNSSDQLDYGDYSAQGMVFRLPMASGINFQNAILVSKLYIQTNGFVGIGTTTPAHQLELSTNDAAKPGTNTWTVVSDIRMKQNIKPFTEGLSKLLQIEPIEYNYNERSGYDTKPSYVGVVAQDLQKIAPYMVGKFKKDNEEFLDINTSAMTYMMINAIKEQQKMIEDLKKEIEALKKK
jgi:hypothetical protein